MFPVTRNTPGGKGGRCVRLTTYHHYSAVVKKSSSLNSARPLSVCMTCNGCALPLPLSNVVNCLKLEMVVHFSKHSMQPSVNNYFPQLRSTYYLTIFVEKVVECCKNFYRFNLYCHSCCKITEVMRKMKSSLLSTALICSSPVFVCCMELGTDWLVCITVTV